MQPQGLQRLLLLLLLYIHKVKIVNKFLTQAAYLVAAVMNLDAREAPARLVTQRHNEGMHAMVHQPTGTCRHMNMNMNMNMRHRQQTDMGSRGLWVIQGVLVATEPSVVR